MPGRTLSPRRRAGFTYLELEIAFGLFALSLAGIAPLVVFQSRHLQRVERKLEEKTKYYLVPADNAWARKLGAAATLGEVEPDGPPEPPPLLIDDKDDGFAALEEGSKDWFEKDDLKGADRPYEHRVQCNVCDRAGDRAVWDFSGVPPGSYEIYVTYPAHDWFAKDAPYRIYDGEALLATKRINQQKQPRDLEYDGVAWESLGRFEFQQAVRLELADDAKGFCIAADAVLIEPIRNEVEVKSVTSSVPGEEVTVHAAVHQPKR